MLRDCLDGWRTHANEDATLQALLRERGAYVVYGGIHSSLFPDALEINPYLTIMALADRVGEKVLEELSAGQLLRSGN